MFKNSPASPGLIERKLMSQRTVEDQDSKAAMESFMSAHKAEVQKRRESREVPNDPYDLVEYFLDTEAPDMSFEVARCRPNLNDDFFAVLNKLVGESSCFLSCLGAEKASVPREYIKINE